MFRIQQFTKLFYLASFMLVLFLLHACQQNDPEPQEAAGNIEGVYFQMYLGIDGWGYTYNYFDPFLLFKDGSIRKNPNTSPEIMKIQADQQQEEWGVWEKQQDYIHIQWNDEEEETWDDWYVTLPAEPGETLEGTFSNVQFAVDVQNIRADVIRFMPDGRFTILGSGANGEVLGAGTYRLENYSLTLTLDNSVEETFFFAFYSSTENDIIEKDNNIFFINDGTYLSQNNE